MEAAAAVAPEAKRRRRVGSGKVAPVGRASEAVAEIFIVHRAIVAEVDRFLVAVAAVRRDAGVRARLLHAIDELRSGVHLLRQMLVEHCATEDDVLLPALTARVRLRGVTVEEDVVSRWEDGHAELYTMFDAVAAKVQAWLEKEQMRNTGDTLSRGVQKALDEICVAGQTLADSVRSHLEHEERELLPLFGQHFTQAEQGQLLGALLAASLSVPLLPWTLQTLREDERVHLVQRIETYSTNDQYAEIASNLASGLPSADWQKLCQSVPRVQTVANSRSNPLIEITYIHNAIKQELRDLVTRSHDLDATDKVQLQNLRNRFAFLERVHRFHSDGEENVIMTELSKKLLTSPATDEISNPESLCGDHEDELSMFRMVADATAKVEQIAPGNEEERRAAKDELVKVVDLVSVHLLEHMAKEEATMLPLVRRHFSVEDQDTLMRRARARVPPDFLSELIPWMINALTLDDRVGLIRNLLRAAPFDDFTAIAAIIARSVMLGETAQDNWEELVLRVPELQGYTARALEDRKAEAGSAVGEIYRVHKAIRIELNGIVAQAKELESHSPPDPRVASLLLKRVVFLQRMVDDHSKAEDDIVLPELETRVPGISKKYEDEHSEERELFKTLREKLVELQCIADEGQASVLVRSVQGLARALKDDMMTHLKKEETQLWPMLEQHFTVVEQTEIVARIFGHMPAERLQEMLPWMIRVLSVEEQQTMMSHILDVTSSSMFEKWLTSWCPLAVSVVEEKEQRMISEPHTATMASERVVDPTTNSAVASLLLLQGKDHVQRAVRAVAKDQSLSETERSRLMQNLMLAPYTQSISSQRSEQSVEISAEEKRASFRLESDGSRVLGCQHYKRNCKVRAPCCGRFYSCRLCHDERETHSIDRFAIKEMMCMFCSTVQPVAQNCRTCNKQMARYFCSVCNFFDDEPGKTVYHCHSCNVCRVGKGLGLDYVHCMKCNACISISLEKTHKCVERALESDCPICHQYLFTSTSPVKYLRCGHLMHKSCFVSYASHSLRCPICQRSLADMSSYFDRLDFLIAGEQMPPEYRTAKCRISCRDCSSESLVAFHFLYNKCPRCRSYNTSVVSVDPNGENL